MRIVMKDGYELNLDPNTWGLTVAGFSGNWAIDYIDDSGTWDFVLLKDVQKVFCDDQEVVNQINNLLEQ